MKKQNKAYLFASIAIFNWASVATAFKIALKHLKISQMLLISSLVSTSVFLLLLIIQKKTDLLSKQSKKEILSSMMLGFLNPFLYYLILFKAYSLLKAQEAMILNYSWPIMLVILSIPILKQKIYLSNILGISISFLGMSVIATQGDLMGFNLTNPLGGMLALSSSVIWALFWLLNIRDKRDESVKLLTNFIFGTIYILIFTIANSELIVPNTTQLLSASYIGVVEMGITFFFWLSALKLSKTTALVSRLIYITPFLSLIFISIILKERILISSIFGLILIIFGIIIQKRKE